MRRWVKTKRAKSAIAAALASSIAIGGVLFTKEDPKIPAAVQLAADHLIKGWEGLKLTAYWDKYGRVWTVCYGETKGIQQDMTFTAAQCRDMLMTRLVSDFYEPAKKYLPGLETAPIGVQAAVLSFSWNLGVHKLDTASASAHFRDGIETGSTEAYEEGCRRLTFYDIAGGQRLRGLTLRRQYGDAERMGEYEICVAGL